MVDLLNVFIDAYKKVGYFPCEPHTERIIAAILRDLLLEGQILAIDRALKYGVFKDLGRIIERMYNNGFKEEARQIYQKRFIKKKWFKELHDGILYDRPHALNMLFKIPYAKARIIEFLLRAPDLFDANLLYVRLEHPTTLKVKFTHLSDLLESQSFKTYLTNHKETKAGLCWSSPKGPGPVFRYTTAPQTTDEFYEFS